MVMAASSDDGSSAIAQLSAVFPDLELEVRGIILGSAFIRWLAFPAHTVCAS